MHKGFVFSYDALLFLSAVSILVLSISFQQPEGKEHFLVLQKQHDLMKVWLMQGNFDKSQMEKDFSFVFPGRKGEISFGNDKIVIEGSTTKGRISIAEAFILKILK